MNVKNLMVAAGLMLSLVSWVGCGGAGGAASDEIIRVSRQNNSGTYQYFREAVLGADREFKLGSRDQSGSKDVVDLVANTPNAMGYSGMGYATPEVKMLSVSAEAGGTPVQPTTEAAMNGTYPLARPLFVYVIGEPTGALKHFIEWIQSAEGQRVVAETGYVPVEAAAVTETSNPPDATIKVGGSDTMVNLAQAWAEEYTKTYRNVDVQVSGGGSGVGIKALIDGTIDLADSSREMKADEKQQITAQGRGEVKEYTVGLDALAIYVHKENPLNSISLKELAEVYGDGGTITNWSQLGSGSK